VLAGVNGAGKSSIGGAMFRVAGTDYYNPDEAASELMAANPGLDQVKANATAWHQGRRLLERAINERLDFAFETTLGGSTIARLLAEAASQGLVCRIGQRRSAYRAGAPARARRRPRHPRGHHPASVAP
jgi:predicted ABC-type ATPase